MIVKTLNQSNLAAFKEYCITYRHTHDESFLYEDDMNNFDIGDDNPTYLLMDGQRVIGVLSLMIDEYYSLDHKSRIRIFHCEKTHKDHYQALLYAALPFNNPVHRLELFIPDHLTKTIEILQALSFNYIRTSYVMIRKNKELVCSSFPTGYTLKTFVPNRDEENYAHVRNTAFAELAGSQIPITPVMAAEQYNDIDLLPEGMQILWFDGHPIGIIRMLIEHDLTGDYSFVAPIALLPDFQGKGLGIQLLYAGIEIGQLNGYKDCMLAVNAENDQALSFYKKAGFEILDAMSCYAYNLK